MITQELQNLIDNLRAPIKSFRIFALEEIIRTGDSSELISVLQEISLTEDDQECSLLISHAISAVKERIEGSSQNVQVAVNDSADFLKSWSEADDNNRMHILSELPARLPKSIRCLGPELLEGSSHIVAARVVRTFCRNWPEDKFALISEKIYSDSLVLKLAALRTMVHMKPELLLPDLPVLLASEDPEIKALAIRALVKIDKEEALKHLQALLLSSSTAERLAGIQNCLFLPFDMVKSLLLKYFAAETNAELLTKAGWIIEMNPDVEVPFSLFEIAERSPAKKAELVKRVLNESVKLLEKSGILGNQFVNFTKKLQLWVNKRNALRYVKQIVSKLDGESVASEVENSIIVAVKQSVIAQAFKESLSWPVSELVKSRVSAYLGIKKQDSAQNSVAETKSEIISQPAVNNSNSDKKEKDLSQLGILAALTPEKASARLNQLLLMLNHKGTEIEIKIAVFQCLTRCRLSGAENIAVKQIGNKNIPFATAAVEYLGIVNPDMIFPYIGQCLKVPDMGMKSAALGILKNFDYNQAISSLSAMLFSPEAKQQRMAMECMNQFDFTLIRDMLTDYLCRNYPEYLLEIGLLHFAANPSAENEYYLYKIEQAHTGKIAEQAKQLRESCPAPTENISVASESQELQEVNEKTDSAQQVQPDAKVVQQKKEEELKERLRVEKEKQKSKKPAYAYRSPSETPAVSSKQQLIAIGELIKNFVSSKALPISIIVLVVLLVSFYVLFIPKGSGVVESKGGAVVANKTIVEGEVIKIENDAVTVELVDNTKIIMMPKSDGFILPNIYDKLKIEIVPYRKINGIKVVKINDMRRIKEFSSDKEKSR